MRKSATVPTLPTDRGLREAELIGDINQAVEEADAGQFASDEEVAATFAKYGVCYFRAD